MEEQKRQGMERLFVPYNIALKLKEKGFDEPCLSSYWTEDGGNNTSHPYKEGDLELVSKPNLLENIITHPEHWINFSIGGEHIADCCVMAPLYQQVIDWFREKHSIYINVHLTSFDEKKEIRLYQYVVESLISSKKYNNYYEAFNKAIEKALKLI